MSKTVKSVKSEIQYIVRLIDGTLLIFNYIFENDSKETTDYCKSVYPKIHKVTPKLWVGDFVDIVEKGGLVVYGYVVAKSLIVKETHSNGFVEEKNKAKTKKFDMYMKQIMDSYENNKRIIQKSK